MPERELIVRYRGQPIDDFQRVDLYTYITTNWNDNPDTVVLVDTTTGREMTCKQLSDVIDSTSRDMAAGGVCRRAVVTVWCGNCVDIIVTVLAAWKLGALVAMIGPSLTPEEARRQIVKIRSQFLFTDTAHAQTAHTMFNNLAPKVLYERNGKQLLALPGCEVQLDSPVPPLNPDNDTALILFSSGTTGYPKAVMLTHTNLVVSFYLSGPKVTTRTMPPTIHFLPMSHFYGIGMIMRSLMDTATIYLMERFNVDEFVRLIDKYRIPVLFLVPPVAVMMIKKPELLQKYDLSCVMALFSAAASMAPGVEQQLTKYLPGLIFTKSRQGYGMTETTGTVTRSPVDIEGKDPAGSVGVVLPMVELKVIDEETGKSCGPLERGELVVRGPMNMKGYYDDPEATANILDHEGWLHTGDIGYYDEDGFVFVVDRAKELIKCRGNQVAPAELEDLLLTHHDIADAAVVGLADELAGELPLAFVVKKQNSNITEQQIKDFVASHVAPYKQLAGGVRFVDEIPKLASGKILRRQLRDSLRNTRSKL